MLDIRNSEYTVGNIAHSTAENSLLYQPSRLGKQQKQPAAGEESWGMLTFGHGVAAACVMSQQLWLPVLDQDRQSSTSKGEGALLLSEDLPATDVC